MKYPFICLLVSAVHLYAAQDPLKRDPFLNKSGSNLSMDAIQTNTTNSFSTQKQKASFKASTNDALGNLIEALDSYQKNARVQGNKDEVYSSLYVIASTKESLNYPQNEVVSAYQKAYNFNPARAEPLYKLAHYQHMLGDKDKAFATITQALCIQKPENIDSSDVWIYDYGILFEYALLAQETNHLQHALLAASLLLTSNALPIHLKETVTKNLHIIKEKLSKSLSDKNSFKSSIATETLDDCTNPCSLAYLQSLGNSACDFANVSTYNPPTWSGDKCCSNSAFTAKLYTLDFFGKGLGNINTYQTVGLFLASQTDSIETFIELQGLNFGKDEWGANFGGGLRYYNSCLNTIFGINAFYDFRKFFSQCSQAGFGIEILGNYFDLYANAYIPFNSVRRIGKSIRFDYPGDFFATSTRFAALLKGFDIELGTNSQQWCGNSCFNLYLGSGMYCYRGEHPYIQSFTGVRYRAELSYYDLIYIGLLGSYDFVFHHKIQGYLSLNIPFDFCGFNLSQSAGSETWPCYWQINRMVKPVLRNSAILISDPSCSWKTNY